MIRRDRSGISVTQVFFPSPFLNEQAGTMGGSKDSRSFAGINVKQDFGYGISTKPSKPPQPPNGELKQSQASRALTLAGYFVSGCMA